MQQTMPFLIDYPLTGNRKPKVSPIGSNLATHHKSRLIAEYLQLFVFITKSGYYIDLFAGPQEENGSSEDWSFRRVIHAQPQDRCLNDYFLFETDVSQHARLEDLKDSLESPLAERVHLFQGDCNLEVTKILHPDVLLKKKPAFALLDQRAMECDWQTVKALADYKHDVNYKIELFYFLANKWLPRTLHGLQEQAKGRRWWGRDDFESLLNLGSWDRAKETRERFERELGYEFVTSWPIFEANSTGGRGQIAYFMIHATDHEAAPGLMRRAYGKAVGPTVTVEQTSFIDLVPKQCDSEADAFDLGKKAWAYNARAKNPFAKRSPFGKKWQDGFDEAERTAFEALMNGG